MRRPPVYNADGGSGLPNQDLENRIEFWGEAHGKSAVKCVGRWANRVAAYAFVLVTDEYPPFRLSP